MPIVELALVPHRKLGHEPALQMPVEVDGVGVHVVEQRSGGVEAERNREPATERLYQPSVPESAP